MDPAEMQAAMQQQFQMMQQQQNIALQQQQQMQQQFEQQQLLYQGTIEMVQQQLSRMALPLGPTPEVSHKKLPAGVKAPQLENFYGDKREDLQAWIFQAEEQFNLLGIQDDETRIALAGIAMRKNAKTWYRSIRDPTVEGDHVTTWTEFLQELKNNFSPADPVQLARDQLFDLRQYGSVRDYSAMFRQICNQIPKISEEEKLDKYIRHLKPRIKRELVMRHPDDLSEAMRLAEAADINIERSYSSSSGGGRFDSQPSRPLRNPEFYRGRPSFNSGPTPMEINGTYLEEGRPSNPGRPKASSGRQGDTMRNHGMNYAEPRRGPISEDELRRRRNLGLCVYCGSRSHQVHQCPLKPRGRPLPKQGNGYRRPQRGA